MYEEACFNQEVFTNSQNMVLSQRTWVKMINYGVEIQSLSGNDKVIVSKKRHIERFLKYKRSRKEEIVLPNVLWQNSFNLFSY